MVSKCVHGCCCCQLNKAVTDRRLHPCYCHLRPSRSRLQVTPERPLPATGIPTRAKLKAAYVWASLPQPGSDVEQPVSSCANATSYTKPEIRNVSLRRQRRTEPRPCVACTQNLVKIGRVVHRYDRRQTNTQTDTLITILRSTIGDNG